MFGSPRSGSTWLLKLLAQHESVVPVNEPLIGWYLTPFSSDLPGGSPEGLDVTNFSLRKVESDRGSHFFASAFSDVWMPGLGRLMRERLLAHAVRYPPRGPVSETTLVIKEPNGSQSADLIMEALPDARLLFLLRDGRDVVDSDLASNQRGSWATKAFPGLPGVTDADRLAFVRQSAYKWLWRTEVVQAAFRDHPGPKHLVRYEDLQRDPLHHLGAVFEWLGLRVDSEQLARIVEENTFERLSDGVTGPQAFFRAGTPGFWRENLRAEEQAAVAEVIGPKLRELGYED
jgi:hypothetical protein